MPIGGLLAGGFAGVLIHRFGSGRLAVAIGTIYGLLLVLVGLAPTWLALAGSFLVLGALDATMDAAENAHGIAVQRRYGRSILHSFHGWWSAGTMLGGAMGAIAAAAGDTRSPWTSRSPGVGLAVVALGSSVLLLPDREADAPEPSDQPVERIHLRNAPRLLRLLGPIALLGLLGVMLEDAAQTWSTVYLVDVLGLAAGIAAVAFVLYTGAMTVGRLTNDRWVDRWGDARIGRWGAALAAVGLGLVALAGPTGVAWIAFVGFIGVGVGASSMFPLMVDAAGSRPDIPPAHAVAIVSWLARAGFVIAPDAHGPRRRRVRPVGRVPHPAVGGAAGGRPRPHPARRNDPVAGSASWSSRPATDVRRPRWPRGPRPPRRGRRRGARRGPCPPTSRRPSPRP